MNCHLWLFYTVLTDQHNVDRWTLLWFRLKMHKDEVHIRNNRQSNCDHVIKTVPHTCVLRHYRQIQYSLTASSFNFNLSENPVELCLVYKRIHSESRWTKDQFPLKSCSATYSYSCLFFKLNMLNLRINVCLNA